MSDLHVAAGKVRPKDVVLVIGIVLLVGVGFVLLSAACVAFGWVWAISVLAGRRKVGPKEAWADEQARRDFGARRVELKVAGGLLACYLGVAVIVSAFIWEAQMRALPEALQFTWAFAGLIPLISVGFPLGTLWQDEWKAVETRLKRRLEAPVLF